MIRDTVLINSETHINEMDAINQCDDDVNLAKGTIAHCIHWPTRVPPLSLAANGTDSRIASDLDPSSEAP